MEIPGCWRLNPVWYDDCIYEKIILTQSWRCGEVENVLLQSVQTAYKPLRDTKSNVPCHRNAAPPMEVPGYWRLNPVWYDDCTYAKSILTQSWRCGEVENVLLQSVQTAYKPLRNTKSKVPNHRNAASPMEVPGYWRLNPVWYDDCTYAKSILTQSWRCGEVENVLLQSVQTAYKPLRPPNPRFPATAMQRRQWKSGLLTAKPRLVRWLHLRKKHINTKLKVWRGRKRGASVGANSVQALTDHQIQGFLPPQCSAANGNSELLTAKPRLVRWLHSRKNHINTKLKVWRGRKRAPSVGANSVQALTEHQIQGSQPPQCSVANGSSGLLTAKPRLVRWLHLRKKHINTKLKVWRGRKRAPSVGANSVQALTTTKSKIPCHRNAAPSMEIRVIDG